MRCKKDDLAVIISAKGEFAQNNIGVWVRVGELAPATPEYGSQPAWFVFPMQEFTDGRTGKPMPPGTLAWAEDNCLWPIRPPKPPEALPAPSVELEKETT